MRVIVTAAMFLCFFAYAGFAQEGLNQTSQEIADRIVDSDIPVVVDFWAFWCPACRALEATLEDLKKEYRGRVNFVRVDIDAHMDVARHFNVAALPTVFVIEGRTVRTSFQGMRPRGDYAKAIEDALKLAASKKR